MEDRTLWELYCDCSRDADQVPWKVYRNNKLICPDYRHLNDSDTTIDDSIVRSYRFNKNHTFVRVNLAY